MGSDHVAVEGRSRTVGPSLGDKGALVSHERMDGVEEACHGRKGHCQSRNDEEAHHRMALWLHGFHLQK